MAFSGDSLGTAQVDIDCVYFSLKHFGCLDHDFGVIATDLGNERAILGAGSKMISFIIFGSYHHSRVEHGGVG